MTVMTVKALLPIALLVTVAPASAQLSRRTFGGLPFWADSALVASGRGQRFMLSSELNTIYEFGDFDRDGLLDVAVEIKDTGGLLNWRASWGVASPRHVRGYGGLGREPPFINQPRAPTGWGVWGRRASGWMDEGSRNRPWLEG